MTQILTPATSDFAGWRALLGDSTKRKIGHNTWAVEDGTEAISIVLHATRVVTFHADGRIVLNSGGYRTTTTKQRINAVLPPALGVVQRNYEWFVTDHHAVIGEFSDGYTIEITEILFA